MNKRKVVFAIFLLNLSCFWTFEFRTSLGTSVFALKSHKFVFNIQSSVNPVAFNIDTKHLLHEELVFLSTRRATQEAFKDLNLDSISTTPIPPCSGLPIKVFLFILSRDPHIKLKMIRLIVLTFSELGNFKIEAQKYNLDNASEFIIHTFPEIVKYLFSPRI